MDQRTKRVWAGLVGYANDTATADEIRATLADCMGLAAATMISDIFDRDWMADDLSREVEVYRARIGNLLRFICSKPKSEERRKLRGDALDFLNEHAGHIKGLVLREAYYNEANLRNLNYSPAELEKFKKQISRVFREARYETYDRGQATLTGEDSLPLGLSIPSRGYGDIADPICDFVCTEYEKYLNREVSRKDKKAAPLTPIFVCPRCNKLVMPERIGRRQFCSACSDQARAEKYRLKASPDEARDYQWLYRRLKEDPGALKMRLRQPKVGRRLTEIKSRQKNSSRCQQLLLELNKSVGPLART